MSDQMPPPPGAAPPPPPPDSQPPPYGAPQQPAWGSGNPKADAKAAKAYAKASRPWYKKKRFILGGLLLIVIIAIVASSGGSSDDTKDAGGTGTSDNGVKSVNASGSSDAAKDVTMKSCTNETVIEIGQPVVTVKNNSSKRSTYTIEVTVETDDGKTQVDTAIGSVNSLEPGQTKETELIMGEKIPDGATCRITEVTRFAS